MPQLYLDDHGMLKLAVEIERRKALRDYAAGGGSMNQIQNAPVVITDTIIDIYAGHIVRWSSRSIEFKAEDTLRKHLLDALAKRVAVDIDRIIIQEGIPIILDDETLSAGEDTLSENF